MLAPPHTVARFRLVLIKPSHYDDDGYVIQWVRSPIPANSLACLYGLAVECAEKRVLGADVAIDVVAIDETNRRVRPERIAHEIREAGSGMVMLVGVQSNQFPRALDLARAFRKLGLTVGIGGFHVSGTLSMLPAIDTEVQKALDLGVFVFAGEAEEGRLEEVLRDAHAERLKPVYNFMADLPGIEHVPIPHLPAEVVKRTFGANTSFDAGRGCPFQCSFCTIINVQGRKSRRRSADDVEAIVMANAAKGLRRFFITDDNFARNKDWELIFDRLIEIREKRGVDLSLIIQVDTLCHRLPHFVEKAARAGVRRVFIGLENISPDNLAAAKKKQNKITEYRKMLLAWKQAGVITYCGYILGFPNDTPERIERDIKTAQRELPIDLLEFFFLTPLPGSEDHKKLYEKGVWMDPDLNKYDLNHAVTGHPTMSKEEWEAAYWRAWETYYSDEHVERVMRRAAATGNSVGKVLFVLNWFIGSIRIERIHPLECGFVRLKRRRDRRSGMPIESPLTFYPRYLSATLWKQVRWLWLWGRMYRRYKAIKRDPARLDYRDQALTPIEDDESERLDMFQTGEAQAYVAQERRLAKARAGAA
jgi:Radical SAM superfamily